MIWEALTAPITEALKILKKGLERSWRPTEEHRKEDRYLTEQESKKWKKEAKERQISRFKLKFNPKDRKD